MRKRLQRGKVKITCSKCGNFLEKNRLHKQRYCLACHAKFMRETRPKYSELSSHQLLKAVARSYAKVYLRRNKIIKEPCLICGKAAQMHHDNYLKPLEVKWYCRKHHLELHQKHKSPL